jgi:Mor family transcriptional regulator
MGDFVSDLLQAMPTPYARMLCIAAMAKHAGESIYLPVENKASRRHQATARMLENKMPDADIVKALCERFRISVRTAWRDVQSARKMSLKDGTTEGQSAVITTF